MELEDMNVVRIVFLWEEVTSSARTKRPRREFACLNPFRSYMVSLQWKWEPNCFAFIWTESFVFSFYLQSFGYFFSTCLTVFVFPSNIHIILSNFYWLLRGYPSKFWAKMVLLELCFQKNGENKIHILFELLHLILRGNKIICLWLKKKMFSV